MARYQEFEGTLADGPDRILAASHLSDELGQLLYKVYQYPSLIAGRGHPRQRGPGPSRAGQDRARQVPPGDRVVPTRAAADPRGHHARVARRHPRPRPLPLRHRGELPPTAPRPRRKGRTPARLLLELQLDAVDDLQHDGRRRCRLPHRDPVFRRGNGRQPRQLHERAVLPPQAGRPREALQSSLLGLRLLPQFLRLDLQRRPPTRLVSLASAFVRVVPGGRSRRGQYPALGLRGPHRNREGRLRTVAALPPAAASRPRSRTLSVLRRLSAAGRGRVDPPLPSGPTAHRGVGGDLRSRVPGDGGSRVLGTGGSMSTRTRARDPAHSPPASTVSTPSCCSTMPTP